MRVPLPSPRYLVARPQTARHLQLPSGPGGARVLGTEATRAGGLKRPHLFMYESWIHYDLMGHHLVLKPIAPLPYWPYCGILAVIML